MVKKSVIAVALFYLLGMLGVAGGYLSSEWDGEWTFGPQVLEALKTGATWPVLVVELFAGS